MSEFTEKTIKRIKSELIELITNKGPITLNEMLLPRIKGHLIRNMLDSSLYDPKGTNVGDIQELDGVEIMAVMSAIDFVKRLELKALTEKLMAELDKMEDNE
jgi:hypothetical protein